MSDIKPFKFQKECIEELERFNGRALLSADMGLGKTLMSLWSLQKNLSRALPIIVVCPASIKYQWRGEIRRCLEIKAFVAEGRKPTRKQTNPKVIVINYDILKDWLPWLRSKKPGSVILDECQFISNHNTLRTKAVKALCLGVNHIIALSGTPMMNRPMELFTVLNILKPVTFSSRWTYGMKYCDGKKNRWGWEFKGATRVEELNDLLLKTCMVRRRKSEVLSELPNKMRQVVPFKLDNISEYQNADDDFMGWLEKRDPEAVYRAERAQTLVKVGYLLRLAAELKLKYTIQWINDFLESTDRKIVVFTKHRNMLAELRSGIKYVSVTVAGGMNAIKKNQAAKAFQTDENIRVFLGNIEAAGIGLNLTAASDVVFAEMAWRPTDHTQAEDRCHRIGQTDTVWAHYLIAEDTIEEKLCKIIQDKQSVISDILDGRKMEGDLDVFDRLMGSITKGRGKW
jgi:SWI/SNF-related matrix-associated actin-dependent regulator 1 of chromatin subfamily A